MAHFAKIENNKVVRVIVAEQEFIEYINTLNNELSGEWIQTSYNTFGGIHLEGGTPLRGNFARIGMIYNRELDAFIHEKPIDGDYELKKYVWVKK